MSAPNEPNRSFPAKTVAGDPTVSSVERTESGATDKSHAIGPYVLLRKLGEGGMGQVWLAKQLHPLQRQVALKLVRAGLFDNTFIQRFLAERQSLAIMNHRAIAKVFDAGTTPEGQPYFVMEYVPGLPITQYCNQKRLSIRARLQLFIKVCEGVQHAHQKAIIHRDLKPANILIVEVDGTPEPRIIDFGIAKSLAPMAADETLLTQTAGLLGTPGYMSPEQADPRLGDVDTRSDVYSLGAVLYALLTDANPFDSDKWRKRPMDEMLRHLREDDPPSPSSVITHTIETQAAVAQARDTEPRQLVTQVEGDLDWITMKALDRERARRYGTPSELAMDIERHLQNQPVLARPASLGYRFRKYIVRNRAMAAGLAGLILLLAGFAVTQAIQLRRITLERDRADRVTTFITDMFKVSDPSEARGNTVTAREILDRSSAQIDRSLSKDAELRARMMTVMGSVYQNLGLYSKAESLHQSALDIQRRTLGEKDPATLASMNALAYVMSLDGRYSEAETLARRTVELNRQAGPKNSDTLKATNTLAGILMAKGRLDEAEPLAQQNLDVAKATLGPDDLDTARYMSALALIKTRRAKFAEGEALLREALELEERVVGPDHPDSLKLRNNLALVASEGGHPDEAEKIQRDLVETERRVFGPEHPETLGGTGNLANYISDQGRYAEAEPIYRQILEVQRRLFGTSHPETLQTMDNFANVLSELGRRSEAEKLLHEILTTRLQKFGAHNPETANTAYNLACMLALDNRRDEAFTYLRESLNYGLPVRTGLAIENDSDLKSLHDDPRFAGIVADAKKRAEADRISAKE